MDDSERVKVVQGELEICGAGGATSDSARAECIAGCAALPTVSKDILMKVGGYEQIFP